MTNIITLNGKQVAAFNGYSIGSYNDKEVTQAITNDNKEPLFDTTGIENINGLTYPFKINVICNDERLTITSQCFLYKALNLFTPYNPYNDPTIYLNNSIENTTLRSVSDSTAPFSVWNQASIGQEGTLRYILYMEDLPAYTYNSDGVISNLYVNYIPGSTIHYYYGENYEGFQSSVDIDDMTWKDHYMTDIFNITNSTWSYRDTDELPSIQNYPNTYRMKNLLIKGTSPYYGGNFVTFDFSNYIGKSIHIYFNVYANAQAVEEGKYTFYKIVLLHHIPTAQEILNDLNSTNLTISGSIAPDEESPKQDGYTAHVTEANHIFTLYANPADLDHNQTGLEGYTANRFDIKYISIDNN